MPVLEEVERRAVDLPVRLAVEVAGVDDLADRLDRVRRQHHRAEDVFLGLEVLRGQRRDSRQRAAAARTGRIRRGHQGQVKRSTGVSATLWKPVCELAELAKCAGITEHMFAYRSDGAVDDRREKPRSEREVRGVIHTPWTTCGEPLPTSVHSRVDKVAQTRIPARLARGSGCGRTPRRVYSTGASASSAGSLAAASSAAVSSPAGSAVARLVLDAGPPPSAWFAASASASASAAAAASSPPRAAAPRPRER